jgi:hypothetical protein
MNRKNINRAPVLFLIFNRPETTQRVFEVIRIAQPKKLYVVADGPRDDRQEEKSLCINTRKIIEQVDWDCEVFTNYSDSNLGCKRRVSSGIDWFFEHEEQGIILEDDCLPDITFFRFCDEMLERYKDNDRIGMISGNNFQFGKVKNDSSYYFSKYSHIWGWATWRRAWKKYDASLTNWPNDKDKLNTVFLSIKDRIYWTSVFNDVYNNKIDTWDYQWTYTCFFSESLSIMPEHNLISNIGSDPLTSTHTKRKTKFDTMPTHPLSFPLKHPTEIKPSLESDMIVSKDNYPFFRHFIRKILHNIIYE